MQQEKASLRAAIHDRLAHMPSKEREAESRSVCRRVLEDLPKDLAAACVYMPLADEVNIHPILIELLERGVPLYLPRQEGDRAVFHNVTDLHALIPGPHGIPEPSPQADVLAVTGPIAAIIPGRAFDQHGGRLGRGNGGYDYWINAERKRNSETRFFGVAYECQIVPAVPQEAHDELLDAVFTARGEVL